MKRAVLLLMFAAAGLMGCNGRGESTITSSYGASSVSGQVVVTGVSNTSPAGVQVSVRGTGMTTTLGADGTFAFASMPEGAVLDFQRAADGIEASLTLDASESFVTVELQQATATASAKSGRRRSVGRGGEKVYEFEGVIRTAAADRIVVFTSKQEEVTIGLAAETIIRHGHTLLTPADLTADTRVHVKTHLANDAYTAILVIVQNDDDGEDGDDGAPPAVREYEGTVVRMTAQELVVYTSHKEEVKFILTADTEIRRGSATFNLAQILIGMIVHVKATANADGTNTATQVIVQNTRVEADIKGTVTSVGTASLVVTTADGDRTVQVSNSTQIRSGGKKVALSAVPVGATVEVEGTLVNATTIAAKKITVES
jgi:hypothetical protein